MFNAASRLSCAVKSRDLKEAWDKLSSLWFSSASPKEIFMLLAFLFFPKDRMYLEYSWLEKKVTNWRHFNGAPPWCWAHPYEKATGIWHIPSGEQLNLEGTQEQISSTYEKYIKTLPGSSQWPSSKGTKDSGSKLKQETQTGYKELPHHEDSQTGFPERLCHPGLFQESNEWVPV